MGMVVPAILEGGAETELVHCLAKKLELASSVGVLVGEGRVAEGERGGFLGATVAGLLESGELTSKVVSLSDELLDLLAVGVLDGLESTVEGGNEVGAGC